MHRLHFAHKRFAACKLTRQEINGEWVDQKVVKYCKHDSYDTLKFLFVMSKIEIKLNT